MRLKTISESISDLDAVSEKDGSYVMDSGSYADVEKNGDQWFIEYIESKKQRRGDGIKLMRKIIDDAKRENVSSIRLQTHGSEDFFKKFGFKATSDDGEGYFYMELLLNEGVNVIPRTDLAKEFYKK